VAGIIPEPERKILKVGIHEASELGSVDVVVHSAVQNKIWELLDRGHQSTFILGVWDGPSPDIRVLSSNGAHPAVLRTLIQLITVGHARLGERFGGRSKSSEGWVQEPWDEVEDEGGGDVVEHVAVGERTHQDNTPDEVYAVVGSDIGGGNTSHGPVNNNQSVKPKSNVCCAPDVPSSQDWPLVPNPEVVNNGLEILSELLRPIGGLSQRLATDSLTTDVISDLSHKTNSVGRSS
jgi:hypothetical protein